MSTRIRIVGKSSGGSAVDSASYISRTVLTSEVTGETYYPKYHEDLVYSDIFLPANAPESFHDRSTLWNSVERIEKASDAQLARYIKADLPNDWSYDLAIEVMSDFVKKTFVDQGMCADVAIHDSVNDEGQRNLHCHIMLTMRPLKENGEWGAKCHKEYILDENGNKIKTAKGNYKSRKVDTVDWNSRGKASEWRKALADEINRVNDENKIAVKWENRSFKEQGIEREPEVHLGSAASALERKGIKTERGNINRAIRARNSIILFAEKELQWAKNDLAVIKAELANSIKDATTNIVGNAREITSEVKDLIAKMADKIGRLSMPVMGTEFIHHVSDRQKVQSIENAIHFVDKNGIETFADLDEFMDKKRPEFKVLYDEYKDKSVRLSELKTLLEMYEEYKPFKAVNDEMFKQKGFARKLYSKSHLDELTEYNIRRAEILRRLPADAKKITPKLWNNEMTEIKAWMDKNSATLSDAGYDLATCEAIKFSRKDIHRIQENEERAKKWTISKDKHREETL